MPSDWIKVTITDTKGSTPREVGSVMWVSADGLRGSIGGGRLEFEAIAHAREILAGRMDVTTRNFTLGPDMGQCCGGVVDLAFTRTDFVAQHKSYVAVFGAGHIGAQLAHLSKSLPVDLALYDTRPSIEIDKPALYERVAIPESIVDALPSGAKTVIVTHDHGLDFLIAERALSRCDLGDVMMIGSNTKAAQFRNRYPELADRLICPIAKTNDDKRPEIIALAILAELLG